MTAQVVKQNKNYLKKIFSEQMAACNYIDYLK